MTTFLSPVRRSRDAAAIAQVGQSKPQRTVEYSLGSWDWNERYSELGTFKAPPNVKNPMEWLLKNPEQLSRMLKPPSLNGVPVFGVDSDKAIKTRFSIKGPDGNVRLFSVGGPRGHYVAKPLAPTRQGLFLKWPRRTDTTAEFSCWGPGKRLPTNTSWSTLEGDVRSQVRDMAVEDRKKVLENTAAKLGRYLSKASGKTVELHGMSVISRSIPIETFKEGVLLELLLRTGMASWNDVPEWTLNTGPGSLLPSLDKLKLTKPVRPSPGRRFDPDRAPSLALLNGRIGELADFAIRAAGEGTELKTIGRFTAPLDNPVRTILKSSEGQRALMRNGFDGTADFFVDSEGPTKGLYGVRATEAGPVVTATDFGGTTAGFAGIPAMIEAAAKDKLMTAPGLDFNERLRVLTDAYLSINAYSRDDSDEIRRSVAKLQR